MGMPGWAMVAGAPFAADKLLVDPISSAYSLYKGIRDDQSEQQDQAAGMELLQKFAADPYLAPDSKMLSKFSNPKAAESAITHSLGIAKGMMVQQASPKISSFQQTLRDPEFQTAEAQNFLAERAPMAYAGDGRNTELNAELIKQGDIARNYADLMESGLTPAQARIATNTQSLPNLSEMQTLKKTNDESGVKAKNIADFARAQEGAGSLLLPSEIPATQGQYSKSDAIRSDLGQFLSQFALSSEQTNSINTMIDKGLSDKWELRRSKTPKGERVTQVNPYTGEIKEKTDTTNIIHNAAPARDKNPSIYSITKRDGRLVNIDATTSAGRSRLNSAIRNGEKITKLPTESYSQTAIGSDGSTTTRRVSNPATPASPAPAAAPQTPAPETSLSKSGKPMIKVNGVWEYK